MGSNIARRILFLTLESPWPAYSGASLRTLGLLKELSRAFEVELVVLAREPLSIDQMSVLKSYASPVARVPLRSISFQDKLQVLGHMVRLKLPYHGAVIKASLEKRLDILQRIQSFPGVIFTDVGHWGVLVRNRQAPNWILNQCDADVEFWRVYASQVSTPVLRLAALANWWLSDKNFRCIYSHVGQIIAVCEEDKELTQGLSPNAKVDVIENGVDCSYYSPDRAARTGSSRLLFTGTSAVRNMTALHNFVRNVFPLIQRELADVEFLIGGNFDDKAKSQFSSNPSIRFTGRVEDMRPVFNQCDVYVAPFEKTHGSKLKIAEASAMGMPIVSTPEGIRGFPLVDGESVLVALNDEQFASHSISLLSDPLMRERFSKNARRVAETYIDWQILGRRLVQIVNSVYDLM